MTKEILNLTRNQLECLVATNSYSLDSNLEWDGIEEQYDILFEKVQDAITGSGSSSVYCRTIFKRLSDNKYFEITYYDCTEDSCARFSDLNCDETLEYIEVFPEIISITNYK